MTGLGEQGRAVADRAARRAGSLWRQLAATLLLLAGSSVATATAAPAAGSEIRNTATATYRIDALGLSETVSSNTTTLSVSPVEGIALVPDLTVYGAPGSTVSFAHTLTNTGNTPETVALAFQPTTGDDYDLAGLRLFLDANGNGLVDPGETELVNGATLTLAPGQSVALVLTGQIPAIVAADTRAVQTLTATTTGGANARVTDTAITRAGGSLQLTKSISNPLARAGDTVRYTLTAINTGSSAVTPTTVTVDGALRPLVVIRDAIPANVRFVGIGQAGGGLILYHSYGSALQVYGSTPPADLTQVDAIAFGFASVPVGSRYEVSFDATISSIAGGSITNTAEAYSTTAGGEQRVVSNPVTLQLPDAAASINYYNNGSYGSVVNATRAGSPLFLEAVASACNTDPNVAESYPLTLSAANSQDLETGFRITETAPNSGVFVIANIPTAPWPQNAQVTNDGTVQTGQNDVVTATLVCGGRTLTTRIAIDPSGVVYDSRSNAPVAGATVTLYLVAADGSLSPATVLDFNGRPVSNVVLTGADGRFQFPLAAAGNYRIVVTPPAGYSFPSQFPPNQQPADRRVNATGSYGGTFALTATTGAVVLDIPLDPAVAAGSFIVEKVASESSVGIGETVRYTIRIRNNNAFALTNVRLQDQLPRGFLYRSGTARLNKGPIAEPVGAPGPNLIFAVGTLPASSSLELSYLVTAGVGAAGTSVNRAIAVSDQASSNTASASVAIDPGVFRDEAYILGKVYVDCDHSRIQDKEELGIPGVRLYLDDGTYAVTDAEGKYSFYGISPRTHVLKLDPITLPKGAEMETLANRNGGDPHSLFVDLKKGELHRGDFAEGSCTTDIVDQVKARRARGEVFGAEVRKRLDNPLNLDTLRTDPRALPAAGVIDQDGKVSAYTPLLFDKPTTAFATDLNATPRAAPSLSLDGILPKLVDNGFGFMDLRDGDSVAARDLSVRIAGHAGAEFKLSVNGETIPNVRVGQKAVMPTRELQAWEYIAVRLQPGPNKLKAEQFDGFGNARGVQEITVIAPGELGQLKFVLPPNGVTADGQTPGHIIVRLTDDKGVKVSARTPVTLETSLGRWDVEDLDPKEPGIQTFVEGGEALFDLIPTADPGEARLRVSSGKLKDEAQLPMLPYLRPLIAAGVVEGAFNFSKLRADSVQPVTAQDGFENDIKEISFGGDNTNAGLRGSMFLKGKVKGDMLLTLAYDSDKDTKDRLFRDIDPEEFYPVYGDSGLKGFDAQSTSKLYVRLDKGRSYLLYGDFNTNGAYQTGGGIYNASAAGGDPVLERRLANYSRSLTGARYHYENDRTAINLFASYDSRRQRVVELRGQGISGPYDLNVDGYVRNSEKIEILTRDRNQNSVVIRSTTLTRFTDYSINEINGSILFSRAIPSVDENLNPVYIRITLELDAGGDKFWVYGADGSYKLTDFLEVGATVAQDQDPTNHYRLYGVNANLRLGANTVVSAEAAKSQSDLGGSGTATRTELTHKSGSADVHAFFAETGAQFDNPNAAITAGRREAGFKALFKVDERVRLGAEGIYSNNTQTVLTARKGVLGFVQFALNRQLVLETGLRRALGEETQTIDGVQNSRSLNTTSARAKLTWTPDFFAKGSVFGEYEQAIGDSDRRLAAVGGDYQISSRGRLYARQEFINSLSGIYNLSENGTQQNSTVFGLDYDYSDSGNVFSEYRVRDAISGEEAEAALGLRNTFTFDKLCFATTLERIAPITANGQDTTAATIGTEYLINPLTKAAARIEYRTSTSENSWLNTVALARKLSLDWTILGKNTISWQDRDSGGLLVRDRVRLGFAYRDTDTNRWMWLGRYETRYDRDQSQGLRRVAHVLSTHVNYQPSKAWVYTARWASKFVDERFSEAGTTSNAHLVSGRATYDLTDKIDVGIIVSDLMSGSFAAHQYGAGAEAGYLLMSNLWVSGGYNFYGFSDRDLEGEDYTRAGPYARLRFKFDEDMFKWLE